MKARKFAVATALLLATAPAFAQGRPGSGQGQGQRPKQGQTQTQKQQGAQQGRGAMDRARDQQRTRATDQQRDQYHACTQSQDRVRTQARDMAKQSGRRGFTTDDARRQRDQLRQQVRTMQEEHNRLMQGLGPEQQDAAREQIRQMQRAQERLQTRMTALDQAVDGNPFSFAEVATQAREVERAMKQWQKQHRKLGNEIGAES